MINIRIEEKNRDKINAAIKEAEGKARERLMDYDMLIKNIQIFERHYAMTTKKHWENMRVVINPHAENFPHAYKYTPYGTVCTIFRTKGKWNLVYVERDYVNGEKNFKVKNMSEETKKEIIESMTRF